MLIDKLLSDLDVRVEPFTLCLLSAGWRLRLPGPPTVMLHFVLEGRGVVRGPDGEPHPIAPYWLAVVPHGATHSLEPLGEVVHERRIRPPPAGATVPNLVAGSSEEAEMVVACGLVQVLYGDSLGIFDRLDELLVVDLSGRPEVRAAFKGILAEQSAPGPGSQMMQSALMSQCLVELFRSFERDPDRTVPWLAALEDPSVARALDRILENPALNHTVDSLADVACLSRSAFARRFNDAFGVPPMRLVHDIRMHRAARLLRGCPTMTIHAVAHLVGYTSRSHFSRGFKEHYGVTPAEYRTASDVAGTEIEEAGPYPR